MNKLIDMINEYHFDEDSWVLVYAHEKIYLKKLKELPVEVKALTFDEIKEARVFNKNDELKIWKYQGVVRRRLFSEKRQVDYEVFADTMLLQRRVYGDDEYLKKVRIENYYRFDENGLIRFEDARLIEIAGIDGEEL